MCTHDIHPRYTPTIYTHDMHPRHTPTTYTHDVVNVTHDMYPRYTPTTYTHDIHTISLVVYHMSLTRSLGTFYSRVTRRIRIDLSHHELSALKNPISFTFLDPLFAWSVCAHKLSRKHKLYFTYQKRVHPDTGEPLYGSSVSNGDIMKKACTRGPPALVGISYDSGQASRRRSYTPILISVGNTDYNGMDTCTCIAYMPDLQLGESDSAKKAMHELRQACIGAIIDVLEAAGQFGFKCILSETSPDGDYVDVERVLFPVLSRMEFDTKERYKFFCCSKEHACAIGSGPRQGHSVLRPCTPHTSRVDLVEKMRAAICPDCENSISAAESLSRRGIHPTHRCTALSDRQYSVIKWPGRMYFGLFSFDVMHVLNINCVGYLLDSLLDNMTKTMKKQLDKRVLGYTNFRRSNGVRSPHVGKLSSTGYLTAEKKVVALFVWSHALGSKAQILKPAIRSDALIAITTLQTILHSVRQLTPFTLDEHRYIFQKLGPRFFRALTNIQHSRRLKRIKKAEQYNIGKPPAKRRRVPYWKDAVVLDDESSDTVSSTDQDVPPYFLRSTKIIPHAFVHFADQVRMGGSHRFNDTCAAESFHRKCIALSGLRSRTYADRNKSAALMLNYNNDLQMLREICAQARLDADPHGIIRSTHDIHPRYRECDPRHASTTL